MSCYKSLTDVWKKHAWFRITSLVIVLLNVYVTLWLGFFTIRVLGTIERNHDEYSGHAYQHQLCEGSNETKIGFPRACEEARRRVATPLWRESMYLTWHSSTLCGGSTCFTKIFGADETVSMLLLRTTALLCVLTLIVYLTYSIIQKFNLWFGYQQLKRESDIRKRSEYIQKRQKQFPLLDAINNQSHINNSSTASVINRSLVRVEPVSDDS